jgi:hypothetical protein
MRKKNQLKNINPSPTAQKQIVQRNGQFKHEKNTKA